VFFIFFWVHTSMDNVALMEIVDRRKHLSNRFRCILFREFSPLTNAVE